MRLLLLAVGIAVAAIVVASSVLDEGEVVTLVSKNVEGVPYDTQLWIVEWDGKLYLRAGSPRARWLKRLRDNPLVEVKRGEETQLFRAIPQDDPAVRAAMNERMAEKYGFADRTVGRFMNRERAVPILLEPRAEP